MYFVFFTPTHHSNSLQPADIRLIAGVKRPAPCNRLSPICITHREITLAVAHQTITLRWCWATIKYSAAGLDICFMNYSHAIGISALKVLRLQCTHNVNDSIQVDKHLLNVFTTQYYISYTTRNHVLQKA